MKFFLILPALIQQQLITNNDNYMKEIQMIKRFVTATQACLSHIMSTERVVSDLCDDILLYLDTMVEIDRLLLSLQWMPNDEEVNDNNNGDIAMEYLMTTTNEPITCTSGKKKQPNFVKSNSLGLLAAASTLSYNGGKGVGMESRKSN